MTNSFLIDPITFIIAEDVMEIRQEERSVAVNNNQCL